LYFLISHRLIRVRYSSPVYFTGIGFDADGDDGPFQRGFPFAAKALSNGTSGETHSLTHLLSETVRTTTIRGMGLGDDGTGSLAAALNSPAADKIEFLNFNHPGEPDAPKSILETVSSTRVAKSLRWLDFDHIADRRDFAVLSTSQSLPNLVRFSCSSMSGSAVDYRAASRGPWLDSLRHLTLHYPEPLLLAGLGNRVQLHTAELGNFPAEGFPALKKAKVFPGLTRLHLRHGHCVGTAVECLAATRFSRLAVLELIGCGLRNEEIALLAQSSMFADLKWLDLRGNRIGEKGLATLASTPSLQGLRGIRLGGNVLTAKSWRLLAAHDVFPKLTTLDVDTLKPTKVTSRDLTAALEVMEKPNLRHLLLRGWPTDDNGAAVIAKNASFARITHLSLSPKVRRKGLSALAESPHLKGLQFLAGVDARKCADLFLTTSVFPNLRACRCLMSDADAARLEKARPNVSWS